MLYKTKIWMTRLDMAEPLLDIWTFVLSNLSDCLTAESRLKYAKSCFGFEKAEKSPISPMRNTTDKKTASLNVSIK